MLKAEKETTFRWDSEAKLVYVYSCHGRVWRRAERQGHRAFRRHFKNGREVARQYQVPLECFRYGFRPVDRPRRPAPSWLSKTKTRQKRPRK